MCMQKCNIFAHLLVHYCNFYNQLLVLLSKKKKSDGNCGEQTLNKNWLLQINQTFFLRPLREVFMSANVYI